MIKDSNERITLTLTRKQVAWLKKQAEELEMTPSRLVKWLMANSLAKLCRQVREDDWQRLCKIARTPWVDFDDDDDDQESPRGSKWIDDDENEDSSMRFEMPEDIFRPKRGRDY